AHGRPSPRGAAHLLVAPLRWSLGGAEPPGAPRHHAEPRGFFLRQPDAAPRRDAAGIDSRHVRSAPAHHLPPAPPAAVFGPRRGPPGGGDSGAGRPTGG